MEGAFEGLTKEERMLVMAGAAVAELNRLEKQNPTSNFSSTNEYGLVGAIVLPDSHVGILSSGSAIQKIAVRAPGFPLSSATEASVFEHFGLHSTRCKIDGEEIYVLREVRSEDAAAFEHTDYSSIDCTRRFDTELL
jgi:hypothetical protein